MRNIAHLMSRTPGMLMDRESRYLEAARDFQAGLQAHRADTERKDGMTSEKKMWHFYNREVFRM